MMINFLYKGFWREPCSEELTVIFEVKTIRLGVEGGDYILFIPN